MAKRRAARDIGTIEVIEHSNGTRSFLLTPEQCLALYRDSSLEDIGMPRAVRRLGDGTRILEKPATLNIPHGSFGREELKNLYKDSFGDDSLAL